MNDENRAQRLDSLRQASERKSATAQAKARRAIMTLQNLGKAINFNTVASEAGVSKDFLYSHPDIRRQIIDLRRPLAPALVPTAAAARSHDKSAQAKLAVATIAIQKLRAENERLREENAQLQGDLQARKRRARIV